MKPPEKPAPKPAASPDEPMPRARKPYQKPGFAREQLFETMALACGKTNPTIGQCSAVRKNS